MEEGEFALENILFSRIIRCVESEDLVSPDIKEQQLLEFYANSLVGDDDICLFQGENYDTRKSYKNCKKNADHHNFIPIHDFTIENLPENYREKNFYDTVKALADLTIKIVTGYISPARPTYWEGKNVLYPLHQFRGKKLSGSGTGKIRWVIMFVNGYSAYVDKKYSEHETCQCRSCKQSDNPSTVWWEVDIDTAAHVVFDNEEATCAKGLLFYDNEEIQPTILDELTIVHTDKKADSCWLKYFTCDYNLGVQLEFKVWYFRCLRDSVHENFTRENKLTIIVSHPHGLPKMISIGDMIIEKNDRYNQVEQLAYTTPTCPGSSGAPIYCAGRNWQLGRWLTQLIHKGFDRTNRYNYSGISEICDHL